MQRLLIRYSDGIALAFDESQHPRGEKGTSKGGKFVSKEVGSALLTDDTAKALVKDIAEDMKAAGLATYISEYYSDSKLRGLNSSSSNTTNWSVIDGDIKRKYTIDTPKGHVDVGVSVLGPKEGVRYREEYNQHFERTTFEPNDADVKRVAERIHSVLKKAGHDVVKVRGAGYDSGFGTKNVDFEVRIKKAK